MKQNGFTLIETLVAIFILTMTIGALLTLAAGGFTSVRYSRNQIVANALLQESLEYVRNSRDTATQQTLTWDQWRAKFSVDESGTQTGTYTGGCFASNNCIIDPHTTAAQIRACPSTGCLPIVYYPEQYFYGYSFPYPFSITGTPFTTSFVRSIRMTNGTIGSDHITVTATVTWKNGLNTKSVSQSMLVTKWTP